MAVSQSKECLSLSKSRCMFCTKAFTIVFSALVCKLLVSLPRFVFYFKHEIKESKIIVEREKERNKFSENSCYFLSVRQMASVHMQLKLTHEHWRNKQW